jgi:hypothetical protein
MNRNIRKKMFSSAASKGTLLKIWSVREFNKKTNQEQLTYFTTKLLASFRDTLEQKAHDAPILTHFDIVNLRYFRILRILRIRGQDFFHITVSSD